MNITSVRIKLIPTNPRGLLGVATIVLDDEWLIQDIKIFETANGVNISMPSRKARDRCPRCNENNAIDARFCSSCAFRLEDNRHSFDLKGRPIIHMDAVHPTSTSVRRNVTEIILDAYYRQLDATPIIGSSHV